MLGARNQTGLTEREIAFCVEAWRILGGDRQCVPDVSQAALSGTRTYFNDTRRVVVLGANVAPGKGLDANSRMSEVACLRHELAHCERFDAGYNRPTFDESMNYLLDEAETSLRASF